MGKPEENLNEGTETTLIAFEYQTNLEPESGFQANQELRCSDNQLNQPLEMGSLRNGCPANEMNPEMQGSLYGSLWTFRFWRDFSKGLRRNFDELRYRNNRNTIIYDHSIVGCSETHSILKIYGTSYRGSQRITVSKELNSMNWRIWRIEEFRIECIETDIFLQFWIGISNLAILIASDFFVFRSFLMNHSLISGRL